MIRALVQDAGEGAGVRLIGHIPDAELPALYAGARLFLYPSLYEGFGLPVLDAMACGTPVLCSNAASLPEAGGDAALMLDPKDENSWADAMFRMSDDGEWHKEYRKRGISHAAGFSWERAAGEVIAVYEEMV
jgi:alpha-1,3-rhamnosyl/mannosyltransferase